MLDKAVTTYKGERANIANNAAIMGNEMSSELGSYSNSSNDSLRELGVAEAMMGAPEPSNPTPGRVVETRTMMLSDLSQEPALPPGMSPDGAPSMRNAIIPPPGATDSDPGGPFSASSAAPQREAVVTSRVVRIEPK